MSAAATTNSDFIVVQGKQVPFMRMMVGVDQLELDPKNHRIQFLVGQKAGLITEAELDNLLWEKDSVKALALSIGGQSALDISIPERCAIHNRSGNGFRCQLDRRGFSRATCGYARGGQDSLGCI